MLLRKPAPVEVSPQSMVAVIVSGSEKIIWGAKENHACSHCLLLLREPAPVEVPPQSMVAITVSGQPSRKKSGGEGQWTHIALVITTGESDD